MAKGKGLSRSGKKHKKLALHDIHRQLKPEPAEGAAPAASSAAHHLQNALKAVESELQAASAASAAPQAVAQPEPPPLACNVRSVRERKGACMPRPLGPYARRLPSRAERDAERQSMLKLRGSNDWCECAQIAGHHPVPGDPNFKEHSMFCPIFQCYAYEIGCCDGLEYDYEQEFYGDAFYNLCRCMQPALGNRQFGEPILSDRCERYQPDRNPLREWPGPKDNRYAGRSLKRCPMECPCHDSESFLVGWGRYVPLCPFRRHGVSGRARGELEAERRGYAIEWGGGLFGAHLPPPPE